MDGDTAFFNSGSEIAGLMAAKDWQKTPLGPISQWPQSLRTAVSICLNSRFPMLIWWGPEFVKLYNDAYCPMLGAKHPESMGQRGRDCWPEIWDIIGPMLESVLYKGEATWSDDQMLPLNRRGFVEECYFTFSYSPIYDETGIGGVFTAVTETTERVLSERRLALLGKLATNTSNAKTDQLIYQMSLDTLKDNPYDIPFAMIYRYHAPDNTALLITSLGLEVEHPACQQAVNFSEASDQTWPLSTVMNSGQPIHVTGLQSRFGSLPGGAWPDSPDSALVLPIARPGQDHPYGFMIIGISPRRTFDDAYRGFFELIAGQVATAVANAHAYEEERQRAEALAELDRAKTDFFSNVSHELRTPLTLLLAPLEEGLSNPAGGLSGDSLAMAHRNALRLLKLVNGLLDFSRLQANRIEAVYEPTDLATYTADLASVFRSAVEKANLELLIDCPPLPEPAYVDRQMWEKIVLNLISNAFKFTFEGAITVRLTHHDAMITLEVSDTGTGIPEEELVRIFERFHRVRNARSRTYEGTGIGLALVQELVRLHGGTITVESISGKGSSFAVKIPMGNAHLPQDRVSAVHTKTSASTGAAAYIEEALRWLPDVDESVQAVSSLTQENLAASPYPGLEDAHILLVDDNADMRGYLQRLLHAQNWRVDVAADGLTALDFAQQQLPDLILSDVMMPGLDGFALLRALRADPRTCSIPVVLVSARAGEESSIEGLEAGADDYLIKPFSARELITRVRTNLHLARIRREVELQTQKYSTFVQSLANAAQAFTSSLDLETVLNTVARQIAEQIGDHCIIRLASEDGQWLDAVAVYDPDPEMLQFFRDLFVSSRYHVDDTIVGQVFKTGQPALIPYLTPQKGRDITKPEYWAFYEKTTLHSLLVVPLRVQDRSLGTLVAGRKTPGRPYTNDDLTLLQELAYRAAVAIDNAQLYDEVYRQRENLQVTLASIGDAVIATDAQGLVTFLNPVAVTLTGWSLHEAVGKPLDEIFRIINETTRQPVESPVTKVLRIGNVVGLANHTLLISKQGREIPIDDSAAPIRDKTNKLVGIILVFRDITERKQADENIAHLYKEVQAAADGTARLQAVTSALSGALTVSDVAKVFAEQGIAAVGAVATSIALLLEDNTLNVVDAAGYTADALQPWRKFSLDTPVAITEVVRTGMPAWIESRDAWAARYPAILPHNPAHKAWAVLPLVIKGHRLGAIGFNFGQERTFPHDEQAFISALAEQCAQALDRAQIYEREKQAKQHLAFLAEIGVALAETLDSEMIFKTLSQYIIPAFADNYMVSTFDDRGVLHPITLAASDSRAEAALRELVDCYGIDPKSLSIKLVVQSRQPNFSPDVSLDTIEQYAQDPQHATLIRQVGTRSFINIPLTRRDKTIGVMSLGMAESGRHYSVEDISIAEELARRVSQAVENALLYAETQQMNEELDRRVQQRTAELETTNRELEAFTYSVSHDLRAPLRAVAGFAEIVLHDFAAQLPNDAQPYLHGMAANAKTMGKLIDSLLAFSRLSRQPLNKQPVDIVALAYRVFEELGNEYQGRQIQFHIAQLPLLYADPMLIKQVFTNLLSNALKFTRHNTAAEIEIGLEEITSQPVLYIKDNGAGFDMKYAGKLFGVFERLHTPGEYEGTGVGLAIVKRIVERHGGRIWAEAEVNRGAKFYFTLGTESFVEESVS